MAFERSGATSAAIPTLRVWLTLSLLCASTGALAQAARSGRSAGPWLLTVDADDDDEDNVPDLRQTSSVPRDGLIEFSLDPRAAGTTQVSLLGGLRLIRNGTALTPPVAVAQSELPGVLALQATRPTSSGHPAAVLIAQGGRTQRIAVHAVELGFLDGSNRPLDPSRDALAVAQRVANDSSLPRTWQYDAQSAEANDIRIQIVDLQAPGKRIKARLQAISRDGSRVRATLALSLSRSSPDAPFRSRFVRLVGDDVDATARGLTGQVLRVGLRDRIRVSYETAEGEAHQTMRVGRPGDEAGPRAARLASLRVTVLRATPGGRPVIGDDDLSALRLVRDELGVANEIWLQCLITSGPPSETAVQLADPPGPTLLSVADGDGLPARGGLVRFRVDGRAIGPIAIPAGSSAQDTALRIELRLRAAGFATGVTINPTTVFGAAPSADVLVRRGDGEWVTLDALPGVALTTDPQQRLALGSVDLSDGLEEFDNMTAQSGTLEERTLIKALSDDDPATIELFIVNRFTHGTRQGEAFIAASSGAILNTLVLDRNGLRQRQTAWTLAHELGHVLLNQPLHPDNVGTDAPMLLMDSDNNRGTVNGPKRLLPGDCARVRYESGERASPPLLQAYDPRPKPLGDVARP